MKISSPAVLIISVVASTSDAFAPSPKLGVTRRPSTTARSFSMMDPSHLPDLPNQLQSLHDAFASSSSFLADLDIAAFTTGVDGAVQSADPVGAIADVADGTAKAADNGWFGFLTGPTMGFLQLIHTGLVAVGLNKDAWGVSIIVLTLTIKLLTYPLTKTQLESTNKMQVRFFCICHF
jgi:YidC/Oxa1 family membrane protein insertase